MPVLHYKYATVIRNDVEVGIIWPLFPTYTEIVHDLIVQARRPLDKRVVAWNGFEMVGDNDLMPLFGGNGRLLNSTEMDWEEHTINIL